MSIDTNLFFSADIAEAGVCGLLLYRHVWRTLPVFFVYSVWTLLSGTTNYVIFRSYPSFYVTAYLIQLVADSILLFGVLVELAWSALRPVRASLPRMAPVAVGVLIFGIAAAIWPFSSVPGSSNAPHELGILWHLQQTFAVLRIILFLALAGGSQLLSIGWRDRELQVATGLGFYSFVSVTVAMLHTHQTARTQYSHLDRFVVASYLCSLLYWVVSFAQKDQERREFSPQMQHMLLAVAGAARTLRVSSANIHAGKLKAAATMNAFPATSKDAPDSSSRKHEDAQ